MGDTELMIADIRCIPETDTVALCIIALYQLLIRLV